MGGSEICNWFVMLFVFVFPPQVGPHRSVALVFILAGSPTSFAQALRRAISPRCWTDSCCKALLGCVFSEAGLNRFKQPQLRFRNLGDAAGTCAHLLLAIAVQPSAANAWRCWKPAQFHVWVPSNACGQAAQLSMTSDEPLLPSPTTTPLRRALNSAQHTAAQKLELSFTGAGVNHLNPPQGSQLLLCI
jgi:hypothetical protein